MNIIFKLYILIILSSVSLVLFAKEPSAIQLFYTAKKILPDIKEISIFIEKDRYATEEKSIIKASTITQIKVIVYQIETAIDIGNNMKNINSSAPLLLYNSDAILSNTSKIFILKNTKEKQIPLITTSSDYSKSGAFLCLTFNEEGKLEIVVSIKNNEYLAGKITPELIEELAIKEVIQ